MPLYLTVADIEEINKNEGINDRHVEAALVVLRKQFPEVNGLHGMNIFQVGDGLTPSRKSIENLNVQIHKCDDDHWIVSSTSPKEEGIFIYDSFLKCGLDNNVSIPSDLELQLSNFYELSNSMSLQVPEVQQQCCSTDSGLFAIAWAFELCNGKKPEKIKFVDKKMRSHILKCYENEKFISFPQHKIKTAPKIHEIVVPLICYCKQPPHYDTKLTNCSTCFKWFHNRCCEGPTTQNWLCDFCTISVQANALQ